MDNCKHFVNTSKISKIHFVLLFVIFITLFMWSKNDILYQQKSLQLDKNHTDMHMDQKSHKVANLKYILVWTNPTKDPIMNLEVGQKAFIKRNCRNTNCYVSHDRNSFDTVNKFDVVIFHAKDINVQDLPEVRSPNQKYVFASMESAHYYPICNNTFNNYFNWTWTYRLDSNEYYGYISIRNKTDEVIGPKKVMNWLKVEDMESIDEDIQEKLKTKKHAAAWFVSNCNTKSKREEVAKTLSEEMIKLNMTLDIFGSCSQNKCPRSNSVDCLRMLRSDYYFYLSFENSFSEDYVTEKLLKALQNYAIPIVYGGANYSRFMPDGIYLDAKKLSAVELANKMAELINDKKKYYSYFKWHKYYSYQDILDSAQTDPYCNLCAMINDENRFKSSSVYDNFAKWWSPEYSCKI